MSEYTDKELIEQFANPDTSSYAFNLLVRKYQERLYFHIRKIVIDHDDADDVLQNVFIKVFQHLGKFREDSNLYTWLYRIATNESLTFLKKKRAKYFLPMVDVENQLSSAIGSGVGYSGDEIQLKLQKAILKLPEKQRIVFNMKYYDEIKYEAMSKILNTSVGALKASYHHAVKKIESFVKDD